MYFICTYLYILFYSTVYANVYMFPVQVSPVVHQLDHFLDELIAITDTYLHTTTTTSSTTTATSNKGFGMDLAIKYKPRSTDSSYIDRAWQALAASQCLFDCSN